MPKVCRIIDWFIFFRGQLPLCGEYSLLSSYTEYPQFEIKHQSLSLDTMKANAQALFPTSELIAIIAIYTDKDERYYHVMSNKLVYGDLMTRKEKFAVDWFIVMKLR